MRHLFAFTVAAFVLSAVVRAESAPVKSVTDEQMLRAFFDEALARGQAYENLRALVTRFPGRLSGSRNLAGAIEWAEQTLNALQLDRVYKQDVMVPHWERGAKETVVMLGSNGD